MPRIARVVLPGLPHHITQRGIRRFDVFSDKADRRLYCELFLESCRRFDLRIVAYCLMSNHIHAVAIPGNKYSIARTFHRSHGTYARKFNQKYGFCGHLWQARPFSCVLDEAHFWAAIRYVERNPVRACLVRKAEEYAWSSAAAHCGLRRDALLDPEWISPFGIQRWNEWLRAETDAAVDQRIRQRTFTGRPCGNRSFTAMAEHMLERRLTNRKPGPKPKKRS